MGNLLPFIDRRGCPAPRHGTKWTYISAGCRCADARKDYKRFKLERDRGTYESRKVPTIGLQRRAQALLCLGWSYSAQADAAGMARPNYHEAVTRSPWVRRATADRILRAYDTLSMQVAPDGYSATRARDLAEANGFAPPLAWDDDTLDDPDAQPIEWRYDPCPAGKHWLMPGTWEDGKCVECRREASRAKHHTRMAAWRAMGVKCVDCGKPAAMNNTRCGPCIRRGQYAKAPKDNKNLTSANKLRAMGNYVELSELAATADVPIPDPVRYRLDHPELTAAECAVKLGLTKDQLNSVIRRFREKAMAA